MQSSSKTVILAGKAYLKINLPVKTLLHEFMAWDAVYQISTRLCKLDRVYKALLITKNSQNKRQKAFPAKNVIQINNIFTFGSKKLSIFLRACPPAYTLFFI